VEFNRSENTEKWLIKVDGTDVDVPNMGALKVRSSYAIT
jgi:hypothetical protein